MSYNLENFPNEYNSWKDMKQRIFNINNKDYRHYGGRGIDIDPNWKYFVNFYNDLGSKPNKEYTLERIDNNKGYWKWNCKWATRNEQARNKNINILTEIDIINIRIMRSNGYSIEKIADKYNYSPGSISKIIHNVIWKLEQQPKKDLF
jgi:hypothetical protein